MHIYGNSREIAERARNGFDAKFYVEALDINPSLAGSSLERMVARLRSLYFARLSLQSAKTREKKSHPTDGNI